LHTLTLHQFLCLYPDSFDQFLELYAEQEEDAGYCTTDDSDGEDQSVDLAAEEQRLEKRHAIGLPPIVETLPAARSLHHLTLRETEMTFEALADLLNILPALSTLTLEDSPRPPHFIPFQPDSFRTCKLEKLLNLRLDAFEHTSASVLPGLWKLFKDTALYSLTIGMVSELPAAQFRALLSSKAAPLHQVKAVHFLDYTHLSCCDVRETVDLCEALGIRAARTMDEVAFEAVLEQLVADGTVPRMCWEEDLEDWSKRKCRQWANEQWR
jgi:hypothetical protein